MKKVDYIIGLLFAFTLIVLSFFWGCKYDPIVTAFGGIVLIISLMTTYLQYRKIENMEDIA